jgi:hypothetical protein
MPWRRSLLRKLSLYARKMKSASCMSGPSFIPRISSLMDPNLVAMHTCENAECTNPNHLVWGQSKRGGVVRRRPT